MKAYYLTESRAAWVSLRLFVEMNGRRWESYPIDETEQAVLAVASGEWSHDEATEWLDRHLHGSAHS